LFIILTLVSNLIEANTVALPVKEEKQLVAALTTPLQPVVLSAGQWPWYGYVILITVAGAFLFAAIALCACIGNRCAGV